MAWSYGYFTDLSYTYGYYPEMSPAALRMACLCQAVEARIPDEPTYLELGFGQGLSLNIHAAGSPGSFWGTDFNSAQSVEAGRLAAASGADLHLFDQSFAELAARADLPDFDIIALHGIWSWISLENRKVITDIIRRKLKPGGVAYISYNCMPGWAPVLPIRKLFSLYQDYGAGVMSGPLGMIEGALQFAGEVAKTGAIYFKENPIAGVHLEKVTKQSRNYIAHEYMNADWHIEHFSDMMKSLEDAKLTFVGSARLLDGIDGLQLDDEGRKLISQIGHPIMRETVRDYLVNRRFRCDVYVKGPRKLSGPEHRDAWLAQSFVLSTPPEDIPRKIPCARGEAEMPANRCDPVIQALAANGYKPKRVDELLRQPRLIGFKPQDLVEILTVLVGGGFALPVQQPSRKVQAQCRALNESILQRARIGTEINHLVSPLTGSGIAVPHIVQLFILGLKEGHTSTEALAEYVWSYLDAVGERLVKDGKRLEAKEDNIQEFRVTATKFLNSGRPILEALQVFDRPGVRDMAAAVGS